MLLPSHHMKPYGGVIALLVAIFALSLAGCGGNDGASQEELDQARQEGAKQAKDQAKLDNLERQLDNLSKKNTQTNPGGGYNGGGSKYGSTTPPSSSGVSGTTDCGGGVSAGSNTSCEFAINVAGEYSSNPGASSIRAYSPVTGQYYTMSCSAYGSGHVCTGGDSASVYFP